MKRVIAALALAPVLVCLFFGWPGMLLALYFAWLVTAIVATPLFFFFRKRNWLRWWQVALAGLLSGVTFSILFAAPSRKVTVRLSNGSVIETAFLRDTRPTAVLMNQCWHLMNYMSTYRFRRVYSLMAPFGGGVDDC